MRRANWAWIYPTRVAGYIQHGSLDIFNTLVSRPLWPRLSVTMKLKRNRATNVRVQSLSPPALISMLNGGGQQSARFRTYDVPVVKSFLAGIDDG